MLANVRADFLLRAPRAREEHRRRHGLRALHALGMVVRDDRCGAGQHERLVQRHGHQRARRHAHGRAVAVAVVGLGIVAPQPVGEARAISAHGMGILPPQRLHLLDEDVLIARPVAVLLAAHALLIAQLAAFEQRAPHGHGDDGVVRDGAALREQRKALGLDVVEFVDRAHDVADHGAVHGAFPLVVA